MNQQAKAKRGFPYVTLILSVTLVLVVAILGYSIVASFGIIGRLDNAAKSVNLKLNEKELDIYRFHVAQNSLYYQYMYIQYGMVDDPTGGYVKNGLMDASTFINYMLPYYVGSDSYDETAYEYAKQYLAYCEGAMEEGIYDTLKAEAAAEIDEYIEMLKDSAEVNGLSFRKYLSAYIGEGVSKNDVKTAMEYYYVGTKYADHLFEKYSGEVTVEQINKYVDENKASFYTTDYTYYKLVNNDMKEAIEACKTADEVKVAIVNYMVKTNFDTLYRTNITDKNIEDAAGTEKTKADVTTTVLALNGLAGKDADGKDITAVFTDKDTDDYKKAAYTICNSINTKAKTELNKVLESSATWSDPTATSATELNKWLFGEGRKTGDTKLISTSSTSTDSTTGQTNTTPSYTWYIVGEDVMVKDTEHTKNAYYIMLSDDAKEVENGMTAAQKAEAFYKALAENKTEENFKALVEKYAPEYTAELMERISYESMKSNNEDLANWLYEDNRAKGDITNIPVKGDTTNKDKVTGHIIAMYENENEKTTWELNATDALANESVEAWLEEALVKYNVVIDYEPETTAATTTTASTTTAASSTTTAEPEATTEAATEAATEEVTVEATEEVTGEATEAATEEAAE